MNHGELVEIANSDELYLHPQHEYTKKLLNAIPQGVSHHH
jgi:peptide/nickel transport system ATP-binding protein